MPVLIDGPEACPEVSLFNYYATRKGCGITRGARWPPVSRASTWTLATLSSDPALSLPCKILVARVDGDRPALVPMVGGGLLLRQLRVRQHRGRGRALRRADVALVRVRVRVRFASGLALGSG